MLAGNQTSVPAIKVYHELFWYQPIRIKIKFDLKYVLTIKWVLNILKVLKEIIFYNIGYIGTSRFEMR